MQKTTARPHHSGCWATRLIGSLILVVGSAALVGCGGGGAPGGISGTPSPPPPSSGGNTTPPPAPNSAPVLTSQPTISLSGPAGTNQLGIGGGTATIRAAVSDPDGDALTVVAVIVDDSGNATQINMSDTGGGVFAGTFTAPPNLNPNGHAVVYTTAIHATDSHGNTTTQPAGQFTVPAASGPPVPPGPQV